MELTNTLAYYDTRLITDINKFMLEVPGHILLVCLTREALLKGKAQNN
jgi:hypothetical protein